MLATPEKTTLSAKAKLFRGFSDPSLSVGSNP